MPVVPTVSTPTVDIAPDQTTFQSARGATPDAFGAGIGRATEQAGQRASQLADQLANRALAKQRRDNERAAKLGFLNYKEELNQATSDFFSSEKQNTLDARESTLQTIRDLRDAHLNQAAGNPRVAEALELAIRGKQLEVEKQMDLHYSRQAKAVDDDIFTNFLQEFTDDAISGYQTFGAADIDDATADLVKRSEVRIAALARDKALEDGEIPEVKEREAVAAMYDQLIKAAVADDNEHIAVRIFNSALANKKVFGQDALDLKKFLKDQTTNSVARVAAESAFAEVQDLPRENRLRAAVEIISEIESYAVFASAKAQLKAKFKEEEQFRASEIPIQARNAVGAILATGASFAKARDEILKEPDLAKRAEMLNALELHKAIQEESDKEISENFAAEVYRMEDDNVLMARKMIKEEFEGDPKKEELALKHLEELSKIDQDLREDDLPLRADDQKKKIIAKVNKTLGPDASVAQQRKAAILEAEKIKDPDVKILVEKQLNNFYVSIGPALKEEEQERATELASSVAGTSIEKSIAVIRDNQSASSNVKNLAISRIKELNAAQKQDEERDLDAAKAAINNHIVDGGSIHSFQAENPELFNILSQDSFALKNAESLFILTQKRQRFPAVSNTALLKQLETMDRDRKADINIDATAGLLNEQDHNKLVRQIEAAKIRRQAKNQRMINRIDSLVEDFQPRRSKSNKKLLNDAIIEAVKANALVRAQEAVEDGIQLTEEKMRNLVMAEFAVVKADPENTGFLGVVPREGEESIGGDKEDVAALLLHRMSAQQLENLEVDIDRMHPTLRQQAESLFKQQNAGLEPTDSDLEVTAAGLIRAYLKLKGVKGTR